MSYKNYHYHITLQKMRHNRQRYQQRGSSLKKKANVHFGKISRAQRKEHQTAVPTTLTSTLHTNQQNVQLGNTNSISS